MLRPKRAEGDFKTVECSECRVATKVLLRGEASSLPKNFAPPLPRREQLEEGRRVIALTGTA